MSTDGLLEFLRVRLHEDQTFAQDALYDWPAGDEAAEQPDSILVGAHLVRFSPPRMLAEVAAKCRMIEEPWGGPDHHDMWEHHLRLLALPYAAHPDYRPEWAPAA